MKIVTRINAINNLNKYIGKDLAQYVKEFGITIFNADGKTNKGWKGLVLERLAGLDQSNSRAPNGLSYELKSVSFHYKKGILAAKETMAITMVNPTEVLQKPFFESHCWYKLKSLVFCAVAWHGQHSEKAELVKIASLDFAEDDELIKEIQTDYEFIRSRLRLEGFDGLQSRDGKWLQNRPKGAGNGSKSRAFYARTKLVNKIFEIGNPTQDNSEAD